MDKMEWIDKARLHAAKLRLLVGAYHPAARHFRDPDRTRLLITAPGAEDACNVVRKQIRAETYSDPVMDFDLALSRGDVERIYSLLDQTWFGVPESTECWAITGFREAVDLLEDPPGEEEGAVAEQTRQESEEVSEQ